MSNLGRTLGRSAAYPAVATALVAFAPVPRVAPRVPVAVGLGLGLLGAALLFAILARGLSALRPHGRPLARALLPTIPIVVIAATSEEVVWRWAVLRGLQPVLGAGGALAVSTAAFAARHGSRRRLRPIAVHLVTGTTFGAVLLGSGRVSAAAAAHACYNLLVVAACVPAVAAPEPP